MTRDGGVDPTKRTDVGYKRPPKEHQFRKGQKPPPRKPKAEPVEESARQMLKRLLQEQHDVTIDGKDIRQSTAELVIRKAFNVADGGNATIRRILNDLLFAGEPDGPPEPRIICQP